MMKKILLPFIVLFTMILSACSCNKFDFETYETAAKNLKNSTGYEYKLTVTEKIEGQGYYIREEYHNKYLLDTLGNIKEFSSELKSYKILTPANSAEGAPTLIYTLNRYYKGEENKFYTKEITETFRENKMSEAIRYEDKYSDPNSEYNKNNLIPVFDESEMAGFEISGGKKNDGYSTAVFVAPVRSFIESDEETTIYTIAMNKDFYFDTIEYVVVKGNKTTTYNYKFVNYNRNVNIEFPSDLASY